ncbi:chloride channel protein [Listeria rocourtiae]|uniref:chloride channel protein n=1 Tax=Listeria rocourtiae TaxID=647910 RepID=UPI00162727FA|nr:chloride channel protein [Listeria rocourtiae]MBC1435382.1 chloride channel protein [Listeria rocourtiae]
MKLRLQFVLSAYGAILGAFVAILSFLFIVTINQLIGLLWNNPHDAFPNPSYWPLIICPIGGIFVGLAQKYIGTYPSEMDEVMGEFHKNGRVEYRGRIWRNIVAAIIILTFGASLGPEAALVSICAGLVTWVGDKLSFTYQERKDFTEFGIGTMLSIIFVTPFYGIVATQEKRPKIQDKKLHAQKIVIYVISIATGLLLLHYLLGLRGDSGLFVLLGQSTISWQELLLFIPLVFAGKYFGLIYGQFGKIVTWITKRLPHNPIILAVIGGLALGITAYFLPYMLFSGEHYFPDITSASKNMSFLLLLTIGLAKLFITKVCLGTGWRGGHIFPIIFASIITGFAFTHILPFDSIFIVAVFATASCTNILKRPLASALLVMFFFPYILWPFVFVAAYLSAYKPNKKKLAV